MSEFDYGAEYAVFDSFGISGIMYETECTLHKAQKSFSRYSMIYVTDGKGLLHTKSISKNLSVGSVAIIPPSSDWSVENIGGLKYIRVIYFGTEAKQLANQFGIKRTVKIYSGLTDLAELWEPCIQLPNNIAVIRCKGLVYYTFSEIERLTASDSAAKDTPDTAHKIKSFIDNNFTDSELNLNYISEKLSYHPNYISSVFTEEFNLSVVKYINIQRIRHACFLMEQGAASVKEIAYLCGYDNADYFSSVFKAQMGVTPKNHMKHLLMNINTDY
jgi:AraC-like DNA-binding protein